ncbi:MAG: type II secretion system secretin GspD [Gammaproteobacteria bacterium]|nr:type II secretion system secretin GspD [Gammaproteobacteria bacterium]
MAQARWLTTLLTAMVILMALLAPPLQAAEEATITPNFKDADIRSVIEAVGEATGKSFIIDPRVRGEVTLTSSNPMTPSAFYETFLSILQVHDFVAVPAGSVIKIVPSNNARQMPGNDLPRRVSTSEDEIVTQVLQIKNVAAAQLVPILRPLVPQYGHLVAHPPSNMLIISDRAANVARLTRIIQRIDQSGDEEIEVIPLQHASAGDLVRILTTLNQATNSAATGGSPVSIVSDDRTNSILISGDRSDRLRLRALLAHLDTPLEEGGNTQVIYLRYANSEELAGKLNEQANSAQRQQGGAQGNAGQSSTTIWADTQTNALIITAPPKTMRSLRSVIDKLDIRRAQVLVEAIIVDVTEDSSSELGVTWIVDGSDSDSGAGATSFDGATNPGAAQIAGVIAGGDTGAALGQISDGLTYAVGRFKDTGTNWAALLRALRGDANTNILGTPSIVTMDNEEAEINVGQEVPFLTGSFSNATGTTGSVNPFQTINRQDVGTKLTITPQINEGDAVIMDIALEVSSISQGSTGAVDLITNKRTINNNVIVEDEGIIVLGGLIDESLLESDSRVPLLGSIPLLGNVFRSRSTSKVKRNLMVFIRVKIMRDENDAFVETNSKYQSMRDLQLGKRDRGVSLMPGEERPALPPIEEYTRGRGGEALPESAPDPDDGR